MTGKIIESKSHQRNEIATFVIAGLSHYGFYFCSVTYFAKKKDKLIPLTYSVNMSVTETVTTKEGLSVTTCPDAYSACDEKLILEKVNCGYGICCQNQMTKMSSCKCYSGYTVILFKTWYFLFDFQNIIKSTTIVLIKTIQRELAI